jgi:hypothetical protein
VASCLYGITCGELGGDVAASLQFFLVKKGLKTQTLMAETIKLCDIADALGRAALPG